MARPDHDFPLVDVMRLYFETRDAARALRLRLETQRREMGVPVAEFYDPRANPVYAADILRHLDLRQKQADLLALAEHKVIEEAAPPNADAEDETLMAPAFFLSAEDLNPD
ncbi:hypothetical protein [Allorhizobium taibaishanense]|uniref:Uncharacterized protein n=2 Tax=Allorhizobium taibaishanense TaxID=887144 RepID=A0A7W6HR28_9HYPH|nr:hypothetical protein [Allorhizobium taibaishanense]MBB4009839.1 hypothetical protein [Allorhizobium taibaishanense]